MQRSADLVIAGAGPGGLYAAVQALERGLSVHIFDKKNVVGIPVKCGEYFPVRKEMEYLLPSAGEYMHVFDVPQEAVDNSCRTIRVVSPRGREFEFDFEAYVLDRTRLEQGMAKKVVDMGGTIELGSAVDLIEHDGELLVGTNGSDMSRRRWLSQPMGFRPRSRNRRGFSPTTT